MATYMLRLGVKQSFFYQQTCTALKAPVKFGLERRRKVFQVLCLNRYSDAKIGSSVYLFHTSSFACKKLSKLEKRIKNRADFLLHQFDKTHKKTVEVWRNMTIKELAERMNKSPNKVLSAMREFVEGGEYFRKVEDLLTDVNVIRETCKLFAFSPVFVRIQEPVEDSPDVNAFPQPPADPEVLKRRPPVVAIMGHVDHGKTTLLDSLRHANVVAGEFGGITQHIGAFSVKVGKDQSITFIDTPGHAAFSSMRSRGAHATDLVVLVVAADDGVKEQTVESIRMANEAKVPIIVCINKMDKPTANIERTVQMLAKHGILTESLGGEVQAVPVSALTGENLDMLTEAIVLQSELMDLKADFGNLMEGVVIESKLDPIKGKLSTLIVKRGTLRKGAVLVAGCAHAKVRLLFNEDGNQLQEATPSTPTQVMGWRELPLPGDVILEVESEKRARSVIRFREKMKANEKDKLDLDAILKKALAEKQISRQKKRLAMEMGRRKLYEDREKEIKKDDRRKVSIIIRADVEGSVEAILDVLDSYQNDDVLLDVVHYGVGECTPNDVELADAFNAIIYCFNVKTPKNIQVLLKEKNISLRKVNVIYKMIDDIVEEINKRLPKKDVEKTIGEADVLQQFKVSEKRKKLNVGGLRVTKGELEKSKTVKLIRDGKVIYNGPVASLRHLKNEVQSIKSGTECGLMLQDPSIEFKFGDTVICYEIESVSQQTDWNPF